MKKLLLATAFLAAFAYSAHAQTTDTLSKIKASGTVLMGVREDGGGLSYALGGGKYGGFHVEICQRIVKSLEKTVGKKLQIKYVPVNGTSRIPETIKGKVDLECGVTTNNATRQRDVAFVVTTFVEEVRVVVRADSGINSVLDLNGKTLATSTGTTSITLIRKQQRASNMDIKEAVSATDAEAFASLEAGRADAYV
jgi:glutamate/aspartate transport system substrate-binding protein